MPETLTKPRTETTETTETDEALLVEMLEMFREMGRICHKLNNPLTSIMGRAQILQMKMKREAESPHLSGVDTIAESAQRVAGCVQQMARLVNDGRDRISTELPDLDQSPNESGDS